MYRKYKGIKPNDSRRDTVQATLRDVREEARKVVNYSMYDFYELEPAEVESVLLDESIDQFPKDENGDPNFQYYGAISANYIVNKNKADNPIFDKSGYIFPLDPNSRDYPLVGESVVLVNHRNKTYYSNRLNYFNNPNSNIQYRVSREENFVEEPKLLKFREFQPTNRNRHVRSKEGEIVYEGRFGQSIKFGQKNNKPIIKIRAGQREDQTLSKYEPVYENINKDKSSIYLSTEGEYTVTNKNKKFFDYKKSGNQIILNSDNLCFNARSGEAVINANRSILLQADKVKINAVKGGTIQMGDPRAPMLPTVNGEKLMEFQTNIIGILSGIQSIFVSVAAMALPKVATDAAKLIKNIAEAADTVAGLKFLNFEIMQADPNFKFPKIPKIDPPKLPPSLAASRDKARKLKKELQEKQEKMQDFTDKNIDKLASIEDKKPFEVVYAEAKVKGLKQFTWRGKTYPVE